MRNGNSGPQSPATVCANVRRTEDAHHPHRESAPKVFRRADGLRGRPRMPLLFSYGTLQQNSVQIATFGRVLQGQPDELVGFEQSFSRVEDPQFVATSGKADHAIVRFTGRSDSRVSGTVFEVSDDDVAKADSYEPAGYTRISTVLRSGKQAWVYADARLS
jgi:hypothetical protein